MNEFNKYALRNPDLPMEHRRNQVFTLSADAFSFYKKCHLFQEGENAIQVSDEVVVFVCSRTGKVWVSAPGNHATLLTHAKIFERNMLQYGLFFKNFLSATSRTAQGTWDREKLLG